MVKIPIWGETVPYNKPESKLPDMVIKGKPNVVIQTLRYVLSIRGEKYRDKRRTMDTFTYVSAIQRGHAIETYEDAPYLVPFPVAGSDKAVLVVPGGGFAYKSSDTDGEGKQGEGDLVAKELNKAGISAFVLWYRTNPYRFPAPLLDMQRAVRYLRFHAADYGIDPNKIGAVGFSAGGYEIAGLMNILAGKDCFPEGYVPDEVDAVSDKLNQAGLIYPCLTFQYNKPMLACCFSADQLDTQAKRDALCARYDCIQNCHSADIPQFLCYGTKDILVNPVQHPQYAQALRAAGGSVEIVEVPGANHGFGAYEKNREKYGFWIVQYLDWANRVFGEK